MSYLNDKSYSCSLIAELYRLPRFRHHNIKYKTKENCYFLFSNLFNFEFLIKNNRITQGIQIVTLIFISISLITLFIFFLLVITTKHMFDFKNIQSIKIFVVYDYDIYLFLFLGVVSDCMNFLKSSVVIGVWNQGTVKIRVRHPRSLAQLFKVVFSGLGLHSHTNLLHVFITFNFGGVLVLYLHINDFINFLLMLFLIAA